MLGVVAPKKLETITVREAILRYCEALSLQVLSNTKAESTVATYERDLADFERLIGAERVLDSITGSELDQVLVRYKGEPDRRRSDGVEVERSSRTMFRFRRSVSAFFSYATLEMFVQRNPIEDMTAKKERGARTRQRALDGKRSALGEEAASALLTASSGGESKRRDQDTSMRDELLIRILLEVGLRVAELCSLDRSDVSRTDGVTWILVRHGKGDNQRSVPLAPSTAEMLTTYMQLPCPSPPPNVDAAALADAKNALFVSYRGRRLSPRDVQRLLHRLTVHLPEQLRRDVTPHALRHTMATLALKSGAADVSVVQRILGHASLATTGLYLDEVREELARAVQMNPVTGDSG